MDSFPSRNVNLTPCRDFRNIDVATGKITQLFVLGVLRERYPDIQLNRLEFVSQHIVLGRNDALVWRISGNTVEKRTLLGFFDHKNCLRVRSQAGLKCHNPPCPHAVTDFDLDECECHICTNEASTFGGIQKYKIKENQDAAAPENQKQDKSSSSTKAQKDQYPMLPQSALSQYRERLLRMPSNDFDLNIFNRRWDEPGHEYLERLVTEGKIDKKHVYRPNTGNGYVDRQIMHRQATLLTNNGLFYAFSDVDNDCAVTSQAHTHEDSFPSRKEPFIGPLTWEESIRRLDGMRLEFKCYRDLAVLEALVNGLDQMAAFSYEATRAHDEMWKCEREIAMLPQAGMFGFELPNFTHNMSSDSISEVQAMLAQFANQIRDALASLPTTFSHSVNVERPEWLTKMLKTIDDQANDFMGIFGKESKDIPRVLLKIIALTTLLKIIHDLLVRSGNPVCAQWLTQIISLSFDAFWGYHMGKVIVRNVGDLYMAPQSGDENHVLLSLLASTACIAITAQAFPAVTHKDDILKFAKEAISKLPNLDKGCFWFLNFIVQASQFVINKMRALVGKDPVDLLGREDPELSRLFTNIRDFAEEFDKNPIFDGSTKVLFQDFLQKLDEQETKNARSKLPAIERSNIHHRIVAVRKTVSDVLKRLTNAGVSGGKTRAEPLGIILLGATNLGKTSTMSEIHDHLIVEEIGNNPERFAEYINDDTKFIYHRSVKTEFHDAYANQVIYAIDDFGQNVDVPGMPAAEFDELIRAVNMAPFVMHMAAVEDKGMKSFQSHVVTSTSNLITLKGFVHSIIEPKALARRFHVTYLMCVKEEYATPDTKGLAPHQRVFDARRYGAVTKYIADECSHAEYIPWDLVHGKPADGTIFRVRKDFVDFVLEAYKQKRELGQVLLKKRVSDRQRIFLAKHGVEGAVFDSPPMPQDDFLDFHEETHVCALIGNIRRMYLAGEIDIEKAREEYEFIVESLRRNASEDAIKALQEFYEDSPVDEERRRHIIQLISGTSLGRSVLFLKMVNAAITTTTSAFRATVAKIKESRKLQAAILLGLSTCLAVDHFRRTYLEGQDEYPSYFKEESHHMGKEGAPKSKRVVRMVDRRHSEPAMLPQIAHDTREMIRVVKANVFKLEVECETDVFKHVCYILFVKGTIGVVPGHCVDEIHALEDKKGTHVKMRMTKTGTPESPKEIYSDEFSAFTYAKDEDEDMYFVDFQRNMQPCKSIISMFMTDKDIAKLKETVRPFHVTIPEFSGETLVMQNATATTRDNGRYGYDEQYIMKRGIEYNYATSAGMCGLPIMGSFAHTGTRILTGIHVCGDTRSKGWSVTVTQEVLNEALDQKTVITPPDVSLDPAPDMEPQGRILTLGTVKETVHAATETSIIPSRLSTFRGPSPNKPAYLRPKAGLGDPSLNARTKYNGPVIALDREIMNLVADHYGSHIMRVSRQDPKHVGECSVTTFEEACMGIPGVAFAKGLDRSTSPGYPYCVDPIQRSKPGKSAFFGKDEEWDFTSKQCRKLRKDVELVLEKAKKGQRSEVYFVDFLKDETRPIPKVEANKTRLVSCSPLHYTIALRMLTQDFVRWFMFNNVVNGSAVGVDAWGHDWTRLANFLRLSTGRGNNTIAGDFSNYDGSLYRHLMLLVQEIIQRYYSQNPSLPKWYPLVLSVLFEEIMNPFHLYKNSVYLIESGMPSGHSLTTIMNTIINNLLIRYAILLCVLGEQQVKPGEIIELLAEVEDHVSIVCYGDDNVITLDDDVVPIVDQTKLTHAFAKMGFNYTDDSKSSDSHSVRHFSEITFLRRYFVREGQQFIAPLEMEVIEDMLRWTKRVRSREIEEANVETALREASLHGETAYKNFALELRSLCDFVGIHAVFPEYKSVRADIRGLVRNL